MKHSIPEMEVNESMSDYLSRIEAWSNMIVANALAIEFAEWVSDNWLYYVKEEKLWHKSEMPQYDPRTSEELLEEFKNTHK